MRALFRAVAEMLRAVIRGARTIVVWCAKTGMRTAKTIFDVVARPLVCGGGGDVSPEPKAVVQDRKASATAAALERVKRLAAGLASGHAPAEIFENVDDMTIEWLMSMDAPMLCKIACANDSDLAAHLRGKETMRGVLLYDKRAIGDYRAATIGALPDEPEHGYEPEPRARPMLAAA